MIQCLYKESQGGKALINPQPFAGRCSLNNMLSIVFGTRTGSVEHPQVAKSLRLSREFMNLTGPMSNLVDFVPLLQHLPTRMRSRARKLHEDLVTSYGGMITEIEERMQRGEQVPDCLAKTMILASSYNSLILRTTVFIFWNYPEPIILKSVTGD